MFEREQDLKTHTGILQGGNILGDNGQYYNVQIVLNSNINMFEASNRDILT